jgi:hypothetical protein
MAQYTSNGTVWFYVQHGDQTGWLSSEVFATNPTQLNNLLTSVTTRVTEVDEEGDPLDFTEPAPTATATPVIVPTRAPMPLPRTPRVLTEEDTTFAANAVQGSYERDFVDDAIGYLTDEEYATFSAYRGNLQNLSFAELDSWWIANFGRGLLDVPPEFWDQCDANDSFCQSFLPAAAELFDNRATIGVDGSSTGNAQFSTGSDEWLVPGLESLNCDGFGLQACWVCQDVTTKLFYQAGFDFQSVVDTSGLQYPQLGSRNVPTVAYYYQTQGRLLGQPLATVAVSPNQPIPSGYSFQPGDAIFLVGPQDGYYHSGVIVRGGQDIDQTYVAQLSYSAPSYPGLSYQDQNGTSEVGRFEVIPLRVYASRNATAQGVDPELVSQMSDDELLQYVAVGQRPQETINTGE